MGRTSTKSKEEILDICRDIFWCQGYGQTSMKDIVKSTGLQPGSIYHFFKNKEDLFEQVIDHYFKTVIHPRYKQFLYTDNGDPKKNIEEYYRGIVGVKQEDRFGCLMINTSVEVLGQPYVQKKLDEMFDQLEKGFLHQLSRMDAHKEKPIRERKRLAVQLVVTNQGFWSLVRLGSSDQNLNKYVDSIVYVIS